MPSGYSQGSNSFGFRWSKELAWPSHSSDGLTITGNLRTLYAKWNIGKVQKPKVVANNLMNLMRISRVRLRIGSCPRGL
jgi:hypothetical protein